MRYLLDTNIYIYLSNDIESLTDDVYSILDDPSNLLYISVESVRELIVAYNNKGWGNKRWKTAEDMVRAIEEDYYIEILPIQKEVMQTYSRLRLNTSMNHKDPSDHVIIAHAITLGMPLISSDTRFPFYRRQGLKFIYNEK
ncbi:MAG: type II toxin-antitoxin system VapC family toxin [Prevotellaceae bacterium]|nr:type II toxin-antitoxin system VapC family toxin [Prevotellaceae bacterium]